MLPEGWRHGTLGEIARITSGGTPDRAEPRYWGGDVPWVTTGEIQFNTIMDTAEKITAAGLKNSSAKLFPPGTLLMAMYGQGKTRGQVAKLAIEASTNQNSAAILLNEGHDPDFYFHFLSWKYDEIRDFGHSGGVSHLNAGLLKQIAVPVAPLDEQRRIASILAAWDEAIDVTGLLLANTENLHTHIGDRLLDEHHHERKRLPFSEMFSVENHKAAQVPRDRYAAQGALPVVDQGQSFIGGYADDDGASVVPPVVVFGDHTRAVKWIDFRFRPGADGTQILRPKESIHPRFAFHSLARVRLPNLGYSRHMSFLREASFQVPGSVEHQAAIADRIDAFSDACELVMRQLANLRAEKAALMADLLTGKRRVRLPAAEVPA